MILNRSQQYFVKVNLVCVSILQVAVLSETINVHIRSAVEGKGFHRSLNYQISFDNPMEGCYISIYMEFPPDFYVSDNELYNLRRSGVSTVCSNTETDIEVFKEKAETQNITICSVLSGKPSTVKLPIHQRYQYASAKNRYMNITLPNPKLLLGCKKRIKEYRISKIDLCSPCTEFASKWREIPHIMHTEYDVWTVPVGDTTILPAVTYITLILTILCTTYLMKTIWRRVSRQHEKEE